MERHSFLKRLGLGLVGIALPNIPVVPVFQKVVLMEGIVAGFQYYKGNSQLSAMACGHVLEIHREPDNKYDSCAVAVYYAGHKIGFVPRDDNEMLSRILDTGVLKLRAEIAWVDKSPDSAPWEQVAFTVYTIQTFGN